jgi:hypothetical protein
MPDKEIMLQIRKREEELAWSFVDAYAKALTNAMDTMPGEQAEVMATRDALTALVEGWRELADLYDRAKLKGAKSSHIDPLHHAAQQLDIVIKSLQQPRRAPLGELQQPRDGAAFSAGLDEPRHRFQVAEGASGTVCTAMVERNGVDEDCGRYASHPAHRLEGPVPAGSPGGIDALIADSVARHKALDAEDVPDFRGPGDLADPNVGSASAPDFPGQVSGDEVAAYLRGEADDLPGEPLQPSSVRDQTPKCRACGENPPAEGKAICDYCSAFPDEILVDMIKVRQDHPQQTEFKMTPEEAAAWKRGEVDPESELAAYLRDALGEPGPGQWSAHGDAHAGALLSDPIRNSAREALETMPVSATIPPLPLPGQPGDAGSGYGHDYIPPGGVPATYAELMTPVPLAALPPHISHSQIGTVGECGVKYRLTRIGRVPDRDGGADWPETLHEIPQWALIGGSAFHATIEALERWACVPGNGDMNLAAIVPNTETMWSEHFGAEIQKIEASVPVPRSRWRASKGGAEGETWWNVNGPLMIEHYLKARPAEPTAMLPVSVDPHQLGKLAPAIEIEYTVAVQTPYGAIDYRAIIDRVTVRSDPQTGATTLVIRDYKTGDKMPYTHEQLGEYANVLRLRGVPPQVHIVGTYFNARKGAWMPVIDLDQAYSPEWFTYHVTTGHAQRLALTQGPTPARPSTFCGGCPVRWACPVMAAGR